jgi:broad specificity phosphatase PhoE
MIIVAHGTVISMLVAYLLDIEPAPIWERLGLPSLIAVEWPAGDRIELEQNFGARS